MASTGVVVASKHAKHMHAKHMQAKHMHAKHMQAKRMQAKHMQAKQATGSTPASYRRGHAQRPDEDRVVEASGDQLPSGFTHADGVHTCKCTPGGGVASAVDSSAGEEEEEEEVGSKAMGVDATHMRYAPLVCPRSVRETLRAWRSTTHNVLSREAVSRAPECMEGVYRTALTHSV